MKFIRKADWKLPKLNTLARLQSCLRTRRQKIAKIGGRGGGPEVLIGTTANTIFKDKAVAACKDLENFHKISPPRYLRRATKETFMYDGSFYEAVGSGTAMCLRRCESQFCTGFSFIFLIFIVLLMAEFFALMPVKGVRGKGPAYMSFSWLSVRTIYCIIFIMLALFDYALTMYMVLDQPISFNSVEPIIFRISNIFASISFLHLARNWRDLMVKWEAVERQLPRYVSQTDKGRMAIKIRTVVFVAMMLSLVEHFLNIISNIHFANFCPIVDNPIENFFLRSGSQLFYTLPYSISMAWFGKIINVMLTFAWNYMDCFVMFVSIGLTNLFRQINDNLIKYKGKQMPESFWSERRIQYRNLCVLCGDVDNAISVITMISFSNNLYFICIQLLKSMNNMPSIAHALYFYFSLFFLLGRTMAVSLYSADIHDESKKPLRCLRCIPKESWCQEVKRFSEEVSTDLVALSGMKFFHLTRKLVLSVAGTIVTYELVLIQFRHDNTLWDCERPDL